MRLVDQRGPTGFGFAEGAVTFRPTVAEVVEDGDVRHVPDRHTHFETQVSSTEIHQNLPKYTEMCNLARCAVK